MHYVIDTALHFFAEENGGSVQEICLRHSAQATDGTWKGTHEEGVACKIQAQVGKAR